MNKKQENEHAGKNGKCGKMRECATTGRVCDNWERVWQLGESVTNGECDNWGECGKWESV